jgi:hypothetical protein
VVGTGPSAKGAGEKMLEVAVSVQGGGGVAVELLGRHFDTTERQVVGVRERVPSNGRGKNIKDLLDGALALLGVVDAEGEDIVGCSHLGLGNRDGCVGGPVDNRDDPVRGNSRDGSLILVLQEDKLKCANECKVGDKPSRQD